jgi:LacI family transcriptional regulator
MNTTSTPLRRVAILVETTRTYTRDLLAGVARYVHERGPWSTFLELRAVESAVPPWLERWNGDGIIVRTHSPEMAAAVAAAGVPTVEVRTAIPRPGVPFVGMDNALIGQRVAEHFLDRGYRRFAVYALETESFFRERVQKFVTHVKASGAACAILAASDEASPADWEQHQTELMSWLASLAKPVGIFAANDQLGVRLLDACRRAGLAVPEEVAVVGCENEETLCEFSYPTLTSVRFDGLQVGYRAAATLDLLMRGEAPPPGPQLIPPRGIVVRGSSDEFVIEDPIALRAVRLIREQAFHNISVGEIARHLSVSRSTLERRLKASLGRGAKEELLRIRFREVERLLGNTEHTVETIAELTGFAHAHYLQTAFRERTGKTPGEYRRGLNRI